MDRPRRPIKPGVPPFIVVILVIFIVLLIIGVGVLWYFWQDCRNSQFDSTLCPTVVPA